MKLCLLFLFTCLSIRGQQEIDKANLSPELNYYRIRIEFGQNTIYKIDSVLENIISVSPIIKINYYYSSFKKSDSFNQELLNQQRKKRLIELYPNLSNSLIEWKNIKQTGCKNIEECKTYFHGFEIKYRPDQSSNIQQKEINYLDSVYQYVSSCRSIRVKKSRKDSVDSNDSIHEKKYAWRSIWDDRLGWVPDTSSLISKPKTPPTGMEFNVDSAVLATLNRNDWSNVVMVTDVTASMAPYIAQILYWMKNGIESDMVNQYAFFNDGDGIENQKKRIGKTGGIYYYAGIDFDKAYHIIEKSMKKGSGDLQENDIEGVVQALEKCANCTDVILIADNYSPVRDFPLFPLVSKPVHIIACGSMKGRINTQYLELARISHGSVHTESYDVFHLDKYQIGDSFNIGPSIYKIIQVKGLDKIILTN